MRRNVPGVHIPDTVVKRLAGAQNPRAEGVAIAVELIQQMREIKGVSGVHIMAFKMEETVPEIVQRSGVLGDRIPWYPDRDKHLAEKKAIA
jgi:methylenetetrahydrofolate reductase (NADPH)